eukprot:842089-Rhodomonas_salina.2
MGSLASFVASCCKQSNSNVTGFGYRDRFCTVRLLRGSPCGTRKVSTLHGACTGPVPVGFLRVPKNQPKLVGIPTSSLSHGINLCLRREAVVVTPAHLLAVAVGRPQAFGEARPDVSETVTVTECAV